MTHQMGDAQKDEEQYQATMPSHLKRDTSPPKQQEEEQEQESSRKRPRYPSEDRRVQTKITVDLRPETVVTLRQIIDSQGIGVSKTVQALLDYALAAYESGHLRFQSQPEVVRLEVVDDSEN